MKENWKVTLSNIIEGNRVIYDSMERVQKRIKSVKETIERLESISK
jgi:hypothetical protein